MNAYHLYNVVPSLIDFIEDLTNTYIRFNRRRFWQDKDSEDKWDAFETLYTVLFEFSKIMAPFTPFLAEKTFQILSPENPTDKKSVHLEFYPSANTSFIQPELEDTVSRIQSVIMMARNIREKIGAKIKIPLQDMTLIHRNKEILQHFKPFEDALKEELNIRKMNYDLNEEKYVKLQAKANHKVLGPKLGAKLKDLSKAIAQLSQKEIELLEKEGKTTVLNETLTLEDIQVLRLQQKGYEFSQSNPFITISLNPEIKEDQLLEGKSRELVNRIQKMRKSANFNLDDRIEVQYNATSPLSKVIALHKAYISEQVLAKKILPSDAPNGEFSEICTIDQEVIQITLKRIFSK